MRQERGQRAQLHRGVAKSCDEEAKGAVNNAERAVLDVVVLRCRSQDAPGDRVAFILAAEKAFGKPGQPLDPQLQACLILAFIKLRLSTPALGPATLQTFTFAAQGPVRCSGPLPFDRRACARYCNPDGGGWSNAPTHVCMCVCACMCDELLVAVVAVVVVLESSS